MTRRDSTVLILGGAGLVGMQCAKKIATGLRPDRVVITSLYRRETREAVADLKKEFSHIDIDGYYGNLFVRGQPTPIEEQVAEPAPHEFIEAPPNRRDIFSDVFLDFEAAYRESMLARLLLLVRPDAIVDSVNTATGISYQDAFSSAFVVSRGLEEAKSAGLSPAFVADLERHFISGAIPQLILHARILHRALTEIEARIYVKVGTTGTGGMGLNIPYTHGEDKPSPTLMGKTATAFAQTGLLFLMARTPGPTIIKEIKPAAMIGYKDIGYQVVHGPQYRINSNGSDRVRIVPSEPYLLFEAREERLEKTLDYEPDFEGFASLLEEDGKQARLTLPCVNTGENGIFTRGEFEAITALGQMEFVTPEEIADTVLLEILGNNTGREIISAIDSTVLDPSYKGGLVRVVAITELEKLEEERGVRSVAIGQLGPPQLAKYLYEAHFLREIFGTLDQVVTSESGAPRTPDELAGAVRDHVMQSPLRHTVTSIGIPILLPDGRTWLRGPFFKIPAYNKKLHVIPLDGEVVDRFARKGWVDLRPDHMAFWLECMRKMRQTAYRRGSRWSSERLDFRSYLSEDIRIGEIVAWIFNNEIDPPGHRIK
jgi:hypothetical protein